MNLLTYLKKTREKILDIQASEEKIDNTPIIEIEIENHNETFENEQEIIRNGAQEFLNNGNVDNLEEGIIVFATIVRGLRYRRTEKDDDGNIKIIFSDIVLDDKPKVL